MIISEKERDDQHSPLNQQVDAAISRQQKIQEQDDDFTGNPSLQGLVAGYS